MKNSFFSVIYFIPLIFLFLFFGCKNNSGPETNRGQIKIITITQGENTDGYQIQIRGQQQTHVAANDTLISENLNDGTYKVELLEVPKECSVICVNPVTIEIEDAQKTTVTFEIDCSETLTETGTLEVITNTSPKNSGYSYSLLINGTDEYDITANDTLVFNNQIFDSYTLQLNDLPENCALEGENPLLVQLKTEEKVTTTFDLTCIETGSLEVITNTSVINSKEIYTFNFNNKQFEIGANDTLFIEEIDRGKYQLNLTGLPSTCKIESNNPLEVTIMRNSTSSKEFEIFCQTFSDKKLVYHNAKIYNSKSLRFLYPDGTTKVVSPDFEFIYQIAVSPDKSTIAFTANPFSEKAQLYTVDINGMNFTQITKPEEFKRVAGFSWSPNSEKFVFSTNYDGISELIMLEADGSDFTRLATKNSEEFIFFTPQWSSDGDEFVFTGVTNNTYHIYTMNSDGSNLKQITSDEGRRYYNPLWSPGSNKILYTGAKGNADLIDIYVYDMISEQITMLTENQEDKNLNPAWSPDGSKIVYEKDFSVPMKEDGANIYVMNSDGSNVKQLTHTGAGVYNRLPSWSPNGKNIAYNRFDWYGSLRFAPDATHILVMNPDGSEKNDIGSDGCCVEWLPLN